MLSRGGIAEWFTRGSFRQTGTRLVIASVASNCAMLATVRRAASRR